MKKEIYLVLLAAFCIGAVQNTAASGWQQDHMAMMGIGVLVFLAPLLYSVHKKYGHKRTRKAEDTEETEDTDGNISDAQAHE